MEEKKYKSLMYKKYNDFVLEENHEKKNLLHIEIHNILNEVDNHDSEDFHIWGLIFYMLENDKDYNLNLALENFIKSFQKDSTNFLSCLYIAHCFHDKKDLVNALKYYEQVNQKQLKEFQLWRYVKLIEQIGYCHYKLGREKTGRKKFEEVLSWYRKTQADNILAIPSELMECLDDSDNIVKEIKEIEDYLK